MGCNLLRVERQSSETQYVYSSLFISPHLLDLLIWFTGHRQSAFPVMLDPDQILQLLIREMCAIVMIVIYVELNWNMPFTCYKWRQTVFFFFSDSALCTMVILEGHLYIINGP